MANARATLEKSQLAALKRLRRPLALTRLAMIAERIAQAFWPFATVVMFGLALLMLNVHRAEVPHTVILAGFGLAGILVVGAFGVGFVRLRWPKKAEALDRLDRSFADRPISALGDFQAIGDADPASKMVWRAHLDRMAKRIETARGVPPDLRLRDRDRIGLRLMALTVLVAGILFGSIWRVGDVPNSLGPDPAAALAGGPAWEGWIEPPRYTGLPSLYLIDQKEGQLTVPVGTEITIRLYGEVGALTIEQGVADAGPGDATAMARTIEVARAGPLGIIGPGGRSWTIEVTRDQAPEISATGPLEWAADGQLRQEYSATDDYGIISARALIEIDTGAVERRYGLAVDPEPRAALTLDLPMPITGDRTKIVETLSENLSEHPWARLPVIVRLHAADALDQEGESDPVHTILPGRRFFDPLAKAVIEMRRDLLWNLKNGFRTAQVLRAVSHRPDGFMRDPGTYLKLRTAIRRLESDLSDGAFDAKARDDLAAVLWDIAMGLEFGNLADAKARLERAQDRLAEAIENGASDEEIAGLVEDLRRAMEDYMRQLAQQQGQDGENQQAQNQQMQELSAQDLQNMLDRLQELMEQGRMAEAQQLLDQLRQMMENMQMAQGQQGQGQQSEGEQAMEGLADTLRDQQGLSDEAFRDLQEQFNPNANQGQSQGNTGRDGSLGRGQSHQGGEGQGQGQQGQDGQQQPGSGSQGQSGGEGGAQEQGQSLADRQQALRDELNRQQGNLPGAGTPEGDSAREALGRAGEAMDRAEEDLRQQDLAGALDNQSEAIEALREGMRALGEMMAQQQQQGQGQQTGDSSNPNRSRDPLGREDGTQGQLGTEENLLQGDDVYRRARELLDEIRRRQGDRTRPERELEYLERLLDRF